MAGTLTAGGLSVGQVSVTTAATHLATIGGAVPDDDGVTVIAGAAGVYLGGSADVTTGTGFGPLPANTAVTVPTTGAEEITIFAIGTATVTVAFIAPG